MSIPHISSPFASCFFHFLNKKDTFWFVLGSAFVELNLSNRLDFLKKAVKSLGTDYIA